MAMHPPRSPHGVYIDTAGETSKRPAGMRPALQPRRTEATRHRESIIPKGGRRLSEEDDAKVNAIT
jgi:hypothetical protein